MNIWVLVLSILTTALYAAAWILAVLVLLCAAALLSPVKYRGEGGVAGRVSGAWRLYWLFNIIRVYFDYDGGESRLTVKALMFTLLPGKKSAKSPKSQAQEPDGKQAEEQDKEQKTGKKTEQETENRTDSKKEQTKEEAKGKTGIIQRAKSVCGVIAAAWGYPQRREVTALTITYARRLWKAVKPRRFEVRGEFGLATPDATGAALGAAAVASAFLRLDVRLQGNFERAVTDISARMAGRFMLISILVPTVMYLLARPVWKIVRPVLFGKGEKQ